jgi:hypothetical protein
LRTSKKRSKGSGGAGPRDVDLHQADSSSSPFAVRHPPKRFLDEVALSNAHSETHDPSWQIFVLDAHFGPGTRPLELVVQLPKRRLSYFAESHAEYAAWVDVAQRAKNSDLHKYYELGKLLGEGGFAKVYAAHDRPTMTNSVVKVINKTTRDPAEMEYLLREMNIMMNVSHPNIVATFDIFDTPVCPQTGYRHNAER